MKIMKNRERDPDPRSLAKRTLSDENVKPSSDQNVNTRSAFA